MKTLLAVTLIAPALLACGAHTPPPDSGLVGRVRLGPQCPVETKDHPCPDKPAAAVSVTVSSRAAGDSQGSGRVVARTTTNSDGSFRVALAPGTYAITAVAGMSCDLVGARVRAGVFSRVDIPCDTGIR